MQCSEIKEYLRDLILKEPLPRSTEREIERHLSSCPACRQEAEELKSGWLTLERLDRIRFPQRFSRMVLRRLAREERPTLSSQRWWIKLPRTAYLAAAVSVLLAVGLLVALRPSAWFKSKKSPVPGYSASTIQRSPAALPDLQTTLDDYLNQGASILMDLDRGTYPSWKEALAEILARDLQGRANFLLENLPADSSARPVVEDLHSAFWEILQTGRGNEAAAVVLPSGLDIAGLLREIEDYRNKAAGNRPG